jgi:hypothetical protein
MPIVIFCARTQILEQAAGMDALKVVLRRKEFFWFVGLSTSLSLFVEEKVCSPTTNAVRAD